MIAKKCAGYIFFLACFLALAGCSQSLRTLMAVGAEQKAQEQYQRRQETLFYRLVKEIETGYLKEGTSRTEIMRRYGDPIFLGDKAVVYRRPGVYFKATKVYMDFDDNDNLRAVRVEEASL